MAKVKVDITDLTKSLKKFQKDAFVETNKSKIGNRVEKEILERIKKGLSPVKNGGRFAKYSDSYKRSIRGNGSFITIGEGNNKRVVPVSRTQNFNGKGVRPVNLKVSGKMLKSIFVRIRRNARNLVYTIGFKSPIARYHNEGAKLWHGGELPPRRILPTKDGETLARPILTIIRKEFEKAVSRVAKRIK